MACDERGNLRRIGSVAHKIPHSPARRAAMGNPKHKPTQPVIAALCPETRQVRVRVIADVKANTLRGALGELVAKSATLHTDELMQYRSIGREYAGHQAVRHKSGQYVRPDGMTTNQIEGFFSVLKRGIYGTFHNVSRKHLQRYCDEFEFRYNHRKMEDGERTVAAIRGAEGKRLMYKEPA